MNVDTAEISQPATPNSPGRVERRKQRTRTALISAARRLFAAQSVEITSISEIAEEADIAVGSFYNYFEGKDELLAALLETSFEQQLALLRSRQEKVDDPAEKVSIAHRHLIELTTTEPELGWLVVRFEVPQRIGAGALSAAARTDLEEGIAKGRFKVTDPDVSLRASGGALLGVVHAILLEELPTDVGTEHAAGVLMSLGMSPDEAQEIAARPLPPATPETDQ